MSVEKLQISGQWQMFAALFTDVTNLKELRQSVVDRQLDVALISPAMVVDVFQLKVAALQAVTIYTRRKLVTKTLHGELLYCLSPSKNISSAFKNFGVGSDGHCVIVAKLVNDDDNSECDNLDEVFCSSVSGRLLPLGSVVEFNNVSKVKSVYSVCEAELRVGSLLDAVVTRMTCRDLL